MLARGYCRGEDESAAGGITGKHDLGAAMLDEYRTIGSEYVVEGCRKGRLRRKAVVQRIDLCRSFFGDQCRDMPMRRRRPRDVTAAVKIEDDRAVRVGNDMLGRDATQPRGGDLDARRHRKHAGESVEPPSQFLLGTRQIKRMGPQQGDHRP